MKQVRTSYPDMPEMEKMTWATKIAPGGATLEQVVPGMGRRSKNG